MRDQSGKHDEIIMCLGIGPEKKVFAESKINFVSGFLCGSLMVVVAPSI
jgi:hypothetical protein